MADVPRVQADGRRAGVTGTPTFFLGVADPDGGTVRALRVLKGALPYPSFRDAIESLLALAPPRR